MWTLWKYSQWMNSFPLFVRSEVFVYNVERNITVTSHERHGFSNQQQIHGLFNSLLKLTTKETPPHIALREENSQTIGYAGSVPCYDVIIGIFLGPAMTMHKKIIFTVIFPMGRPYLKIQTSFLASVTYYKNTKSESHWKVPWYLAKFFFLVLRKRNTI